MIHVAVLKTQYLDKILSGEKTVECRLTRNRIDPHGKIREGERIYFKESSGAFRATAIVDRVEERADLDEEGVAALRAEFGDAIGAPDSFWDTKRTARFAVLIWMRQLEEIWRGPKMPSMNGRGWIRLSQADNVYPECLPTERGKQKRPSAPKKKTAYKKKGPRRAR